MSLSPIVLFVYNRPWHTKQTLNALMQNELASESTLYILADGPKENASLGELEKIQETREIIKSKQWCKEVIVHEKEENDGLAKSIITGVTQIINRFGKIIVLEDDIVTSKGFLKYMNDALNFYEEEEKVFHISGYMYPHSERLPRTFFYNVPLCWGWATWKRAWQFFNDNTNELIQFFDRSNKWDELNKFGGNYLEKQLRDNAEGKIRTWFVKWHGSVLIKNGYCLFPGNSLVNNIGFDSTGVHNKTTNGFAHNRLASSIPIEKIAVTESKKAEKIIKDFYKDLAFSNVRKNKKNILKNLLSYFPFKNSLKRAARKVMISSYPETAILQDRDYNWEKSKSIQTNSPVGRHVKIYPPYIIRNTAIGDYTYITDNANISLTKIGKFCSIGANFLCGWGIHPTNGLSTSPMFYSPLKQNGMTLSAEDKIVERKEIIIGNDVFIGANVTVLDGVNIGDGAVIGAGAVVSKDIPSYAIAVGNPIKVIKYRFTEEQITRLLKIKWWNFDDEKLKDVERDFFNIEEFLRKYDYA